MKNCPQCMQQVSDDTAFCPNCGCQIPTYIQPINGAPQRPVVADKVSIPFCILAFLIPIFGVIYWGVMHKTSPKKAKACGIVGLISWAINFIVIMSQMM